MASNLTKPENKKVLTRSDITKLGYMSNFLQISFNYERMQAGGWLFSMLPFLKKIYKDDKEGLALAMRDNLTFINTSPPLVSFLMGLLLSLEESKQDRSIINGLKNALFGPLAGIGDAIFWFTVLPIVAGISSSFAMQGSVLGPILFLVVYLIIFFAKIPLAHLGYGLGTKALDWIQQYSSIISNAATILGVTVVGGLIARTVHINILSTFEFIEGQTFSLQENFLDSILPNLLPIAYTLLLYWALKKKNVNPVWLILGTFVLALLFSYLGVL
ncbi:PTS galactosamine transporter subunit IID [Jeotgalibaca sp. A127]|uniref:PTS galactosamine transporter subunit IID n=1 Tax=Jeotgalibaca sp. A127 TaxID=3457324 RepID=UPI003FCEF0EA